MKTPAQHDAELLEAVRPVVDNEELVERIFEELRHLSPYQEHRREALHAKLREAMRERGASDAPLVGGVLRDGSHRQPERPEVPSVLGHGAKR